MKNTYSFQEYDLINYLNKKRYNNTVFIILIIGIIYLIFGFNFHVYDKEILIKDNNKYSLIIDSRKIDNLYRNKYVYINNKKYKYKIIDIDNNYQNIDGIIYQTIYLDIKYKGISSINEVYFLKYKKSLFKMIIDSKTGG